MTLTRGPSEVQNVNLAIDYKRISPGETMDPIGSVLGFQVLLPNSKSSGEFLAGNLRSMFLKSSLDLDESPEFRGCRERIQTSSSCFGFFGRIWDGRLPFCPSFFPLLHVQLICVVVDDIVCSGMYKSPSLCLLMKNEYIFLRFCRQDLVSLREK